MTRAHGNPKIIWTPEMDAKLRAHAHHSQRELERIMGMSRQSVANRMRALGMTQPRAAKPAQPAKPQRPKTPYDAREPLPAGHPVSWGLITAGTSLANTLYPVESSNMVLGRDLRAAEGGVAFGWYEGSGQADNGSGGPQIGSPCNACACVPARGSV